MNKFIFVFVLTALFACKEQKSEKVSESAIQEIETPTQWVVFEGNDSNAKHIVLVSGDEEYRSEEALPQLAKILSKHHGFKCTVLFAQNPETPGIVDANYVKNIPGLEALNTADLMVIFTRFRALPDSQMKHIDNYLMRGKPVVGIRTATHAFNFSKDSTSNYAHYGNNYKGAKEEWKDGFGRLVLGENWVSHHGHHKHQSTKGIVAENANDIANGIKDGDVWGASDVYEVRLPLPGDSQPVVYGLVMNRTGEFDENDIFFGMKPTDDEIAKVNNNDKAVNDVKMPVAWTKSYQLPGGEKGKAFTSTVGAANDMIIEGTRRLLVNSVFWGLNMPVPEKANVDLIGTYKPTAYGFTDTDHWTEKQMQISEIQTFYK